MYTIRHLICQPSVVQKCGKTLVCCPDMGLAHISFSAPQGGIEVFSYYMWSAWQAHSPTMLWFSVRRAACHSCWLAWYWNTLAGSSYISERGSMIQLKWAHQGASSASCKTAASCGLMSISDSCTPKLMWTRVTSWIWKTGWHKAGKGHPSNKM